MKVFPVIAFTPLVFIFLAPGVFAQPSSFVDLTPRIVVRGEGAVSLPADQVRLEIGVVTEARSAKSAAARNAKKLKNTLKNLRKVLGNKGKIETIGYVVLPRYQVSKKSGSPKISGYSATSTVRVVSNEVSLIGELIDEATGSGANRILNLEFILRDEEKPRLQALKQAARQAKGKAEALASALGLRVTQVIIVEEVVGGGGFARVQMTTFAAKGVSTPIKPGSVEIKASITMTVKLGK